MISISVIVVLAAAYVLITGKPNQSVSQTVESSMTRSYSVNLSEQNDSGEYGTATLREEGGKVKVTLSISGAPQDVTQPAHIHMGSCPEVGAVKYPLTFPINGTSETTLDTTLDQLKSQLPLSINVHKSAEEAKMYVACGDLVI